MNAENTKKISGKVVKVLYQNDDNNYAIIKLKVDSSTKKKYIDYLYENNTAVSCYYDRVPLEGENIEYTGEFIENKYGLQFKANHFIRIKTDSLDSVVAYLSSNFFPGIGKIMAMKIYSILGKNCLEKIRKNKSELDKISGITEIQKDTIYEGLVENRKKEKNVIDFMNLGFTLQMASTITNSLNRIDLEEAKENPYILIDKIEGIGFLKADKIAFNLGIAFDDPIRIKAYIVYIMNQASNENGNTYILKSELIDRLNLPDLDINKYLEMLAKDGKIVIEKDDFEERIYDYYLYASEGKLAALIASKIANNKGLYEEKKIKKAIKKIKQSNKIEYTEMQEKAILYSFLKKIVIITGGPGTGKSTIVKGIIDTYKVLSKKKQKIALLAPTGRAGRRLAEVTNEPAQTIHRFLGYDGKDFSHNELNKVSCDMVIIDEMSMVDLLLATKLFESLPFDCSIVIVGDADQIPSVAPGAVLDDLIKTSLIDTIKLDKIHRQAQNSSIISLAHDVNNGIIPLDLPEKKPDRSFTYITDDDYILQTIENIVSKAVKQNMSLQKDIQVLIPMYRGKLGIDNVNNLLQEKFNPLTDEGNEIIYNNQKFRINDKVIQLVNRNSDNIANGDIGYIYDFKYSDDRIVGMHVMFDTGLVEYSKETYEELKLAYAISIHKSQGSEFFTTIIPFSKSYYRMLKRRLYYTGITRAKRYLIMIGDIDAFRIAVNSNVYFRYTKLCDKIKDKIKEPNISMNDFKNTEENN